jgi:tetratricopeptide (TPR) repeat protein
MAAPPDPFRARPEPSKYRAAIRAAASASGIANHGKECAKARRPPPLVGFLDGFEATKSVIVNGVLSGAAYVAPMNANTALIDENSAADDTLIAGVRDVRAYFDVGNFREALNVCEGLIAYRPDSAEALLLLGLISFELEEPQRALLLLRQAHERAPQVREYADALACVNAQLGDDIEALYFAKVAAILQPHPLGEALLPEGYSKFFESLRDARPHLFRHRAQRQFDKGNAVSALASCEKQLEISPNDSETWRLLARAALEVGNVERVIDACEFLSADTLLASDYDVLARALAKVGRFDEAERAHANAIECEPDNPSLSQSRIRTLAARHGSAGGYLGRENSAWVAQFTARAAARQERPATDSGGARCQTFSPFRLHGKQML